MSHPDGFITASSVKMDRHLCSTDADLRLYRIDNVLNDLESNSWGTYWRIDQGGGKLRVKGNKEPMGGPADI